MMRSKAVSGTFAWTSERSLGIVSTCCHAAGAARKVAQCAGKISAFYTTFPVVNGVTVLGK